MMNVAFLLQSWDILFIFLHLSWHEFIGNGFQQFRLLSIGSHKVCFSRWGRLALQLNSNTFLFGFLLFLIIFLHMVQEVISALWVLNRHPMHINSLVKNLAFNFFVYDNANSMLDNTVDSSSFAWVTFVGHSILNSAHFFNVHNIVSQIHMYVAKGTTSCFL